jgi:2,4-dichlorophenol 6-monooxygenase
LRRVRTQVLIVGAGGSGLALTIFLGDLGVDCLTVERHPGTSHLPKAHYINQRTMEVFRQHGASDTIYAHGPDRENLQRVRWMTSIGGDGPLDRMKIIAPAIMGGADAWPAYEEKGTTRPTNIPQIRLEPVLAQIAEDRGPGRMRFGHELLSMRQDDKGVLAVVRDLAGGETFEVECDYLIAADGGRTLSPMVGVEMVGDTGLGDFYTIWFSADLSSLLDEDDTPMRRVFHPSDPLRVASLLTFGPTRFDRHSEEWASSFSRSRRMLSDEGSVEITDEEIAEIGLKQLKIDVPVTINKVSRWKLETVVADQFRVGRMILIGDAAHRHPPGGGLGLNSGFQDAHNLAWKLALVLQGQAPDALLDSYEAERRPVVTSNAEWAMQAMTTAFTCMASLGVIPGETPEQTTKRFELLMSDTPMGATRRAQMEEVFRVQRVEYVIHDMEMGFTYDRGAVADDGSPPAWRDPMGHEYRPTTRPGSRLPHAWLDRAGERVSTHDLVPLGGFALITDPSGLDWMNAAARIAAETGVAIRTVRIGEGGETSDRSGAWARLRQVDDGGCVLVRPDNHVGFRAIGRSANAEADLRAAFDRILGYGPA